MPASHRQRARIGHARTAPGDRLLNSGEGARHVHQEEVAVGSHCGAGCCGLRAGRTAPRRAGECDVAGDRRVVHLHHRLSFLRPVDRQHRAGRECRAANAGLSTQRRPRLRADEPLRALRPSFRRHRRRRTTRGAGTRRADGLSPGDSVDPRRRGVRRRRAGHDRAVPLDTARRPLARGHDPLGDGRRGRNGGRRRRTAHLRHHPGGPGAGRGECPESKPLGHVHGRLHHTDRARDGDLRSLRAPGAGR